MTLDFFESANGVDNDAAIAALGLLTDQVELALDLASAVPESPAGGPGGLDIPGSGLLELLIACDDGRPSIFPDSSDLKDCEGDRFVSMRDLYDEDLSYILVPLER